LKPSFVDSGTVEAIGWPASSAGACSREVDEQPPLRLVVDRRSTWTSMRR
jgi:hypothetical protein